MKTSNEFKQALRAGKLSEAFLLAMSNAPQLHITTWVASAQDDASPQDRDSDRPPAGNYLRTHINLVEGKIENEIGEKILADGNSAISKFHWQQVNQGHQAIQQNLQSLQKMFHLMTAFEQQRQTNNAIGMNWVDVETDNDSGTSELSGDYPKGTLRDRSIGSLGAAQSDLASGEITGSPTAEETSTIRTTKVEPQLPAFAQEQEDDDDDGVVDDLLSLADLDDEPDLEPEDNEDWGEWLEDEEGKVKPELVNLNSLNHQS